MTTTTRRALLGATAAALPAAALPIGGLPALAAMGTVAKVSELDYDGIRERIALVCETFMQPTVGFPDPMTAEEAAVAMAWTDDEINESDDLIQFGYRWGLSFDWLIMGDVKALIHNTRGATEARRTAREDPALAAAMAWADLRDRETAFNTGGEDWEDCPEAVTFSEAADNAFKSLAELRPVTVGGAASVALAYLASHVCTRGALVFDPSTWREVESLDEKQETVALALGPVLVSLLSDRRCIA